MVDADEERYYYWEVGSESCLESQMRSPAGSLCYLAPLKASSASYLGVS